MTKWIAAIVVVIIIAGAGWYFLSRGSSGSQAPAQTTQTPADPTAGWTMYASSTLGFSLKYPPGWTFNASYKYTQVSPTKPIMGVALTIPATMATGTNLGSDTYMS